VVHVAVLVCTGSQSQLSREAPSPERIGQLIAAGKLVTLARQEYFTIILQLLKQAAKTSAFKSKRMLVL
jgi:hypothetical protein